MEGGTEGGTKWLLVATQKGNVVSFTKQTTHLPHEDGVTPVHHVVDLAALVVDVEGEFFAYDHVPGGAEKVVQSNLDFLCCVDHASKGASRHIPRNDKM